MLASKAPAFLVEASLPKDPDRSHLADAIHFMDLIDLADEELPAARATVERSKAAAATARVDLDAPAMAGAAPGTLHRSGERL